MVVALLISTLLASDPAEVRHARTKVTFTLGLGDFMGSVMAAPSYKEMVDHARVEAVSDLMVTHGSPLDSQYLLEGVPVVGPWALLAHGGPQVQQDMWLLVTAGALQAIGVTALTYRFFSERYSPQAEATSTDRPQGIEVSLSPVVSGRLGVGLTVTGF